MEFACLRHRVDVLRPVASPAAHFGEVGITWVTDATRWAEVKPAAAATVEYAGEQQSEVTHTVTMRLYTGLPATYRIRYGTRNFEILGSYDVDERHWYTVILCKEINAD